VDTFRRIIDEIHASFAVARRERRPEYNHAEHTIFVSMKREKPLVPDAIDLLLMPISPPFIQTA